jgi:hypothetical protein
MAWKGVLVLTTDEEETQEQLDIDTGSGFEDDLRRYLLQQLRKGFSQIVFHNPASGEERVLAVSTLLTFCGLDE